MTRVGALALPLEIAIERAGGLPADVVHGLDLLARSPALWPLGEDAWRSVVAVVWAFAERWDGQARAEGWTELELYGLHRGAPYANLAGMGAAFVVARSGHSVVGVADRAIVMRSVGGATLRQRRFVPDACAVLAWSLCWGSVR